MSPAESPAVQVIEIPTDKILPNPENPRGPVAPEDARTMAESITEMGQKTEIRVRWLTESEKAQHPGYEVFLIGGHRRLAGAKLAGRPTLRAIVVEGIVPGQELLDALIDNRSEDMGWWKWDLAIEKLFKADPDISVRKLAAKLGWHHSKLVRATKILRALNPTARELVDKNLAFENPESDESGAPRTTKNKGFLVTESILLALADLGDPQAVEQGLRRVIDDQMTESR